jgi:pilus assembly protein Flp/PilA
MMQMHPRLETGLRRFRDDEAAATAIEYALIASVVSIAILAAVLAIGSAMETVFYDRIGKAFEQAMGN